MGLIAGPAFAASNGDNKGKPFQELQAAVDAAVAAELLTPLEEKPSGQELSDTLTSESAFEEPEAQPVESAPEQMVGISEQMIEDVVSRVVQDVVERVTRETMIEVAERVITEAIDALKKSLETISD